MKKIFFALGVVGLIGLASCSKEKTCICTQTVTGEGSELFEDIITDFVTEEECSDANTEVTVMGLTTTVTCVEE